MTPDFPKAPSEHLAPILAPKLHALPPQTLFTRQRQAVFLQLLADSGEVRVAARAAAVSHQTVYRMRRACAYFKQGWDAALIVAREKAEEALASRAMHGVEEEVFYHGEVVATRRRYDSRLLLAHLGRLDRLAQSEDVAALSDRFDAVIDAFEACGEDALEEQALRRQAEAETLDLTAVELPELELAETAANAASAASGAADEAAGPVGEDACDTAPETSPEPCNTWSMSGDETQDERPDRAEAEEGGEGAPDGPDDPFPTLEQRLQAMEAARPDDAEPLHRFADPGEAEMAQLLGFEAGMGRWWAIADGADMVGEDALSAHPGPCETAHGLGRAD